MRTKNVIGIVLATALVLLVPLLAMQFNSGVNWGAADFIAAGGLLLGTGLLFELAASRTGNLAYRAAIGIALAASLLLVWINLAVGIIGNEDNPANLMYVGVLAVGFLGAVSSGFQPRGMAYALFATALAQMSVGVIALVAGMDHALPLDAAFTTLWLGSALLFRRASAASATWQPA